jgi:predicted nucleic acid-binding Zn ribbon protein
VSRTKAPETIGSVIEANLRELGYLSPCRELDVVHKWPGIVGAKIASVTECSRVDNGVLYVRVASASWRQEISYIKQHILETIRKETPCTSIRDVVFY